MSEQSFCYKYPHPSVTADCVIFGFDGVSIKVLLIQRGIEPFKGKWAFPGGFMKISETAEECAKRELEEETGLKNASVEQFYTFSDVNRDPRERVLTVAHYALVRLSEVKGGDDAASACWFSMAEVPSLAFDHDRILRMAVNRLKERICFEPIGFELLPEEFDYDPELTERQTPILTARRVSSDGKVCIEGYSNGAIKVFSIQERNSIRTLIMEEDSFITK